jgi:hypothetical protein
MRRSIDLFMGLFINDDLNVYQSNDLLEEHNQSFLRKNDRQEVLKEQEKINLSLQKSFDC